jgi:Holliday junction resolvasome RuvABC endonuclease subunit
MKIKLTEIEKKLGYKLHRDVYVLGVDTASTTGLAIANTDKKTLTIETSIFKLPAANKNDEFSEKYVEKLECMLTLIREFKTKLKPKKESILVLENSFLSVNPVTFGCLRMLCGIIYAELYDIFEHIILVFPISARKEVGFKSQLPKGTKSKEKKQEIINWINDKFGIQERSTDICDAILLALYGLKHEKK